MVGAGAAEGEEVAAWLEDAERLGPGGGVVGDAGAVPALPHEAELIGRVGDDGVDRVGREAAHYLEAVATKDDVARGGHLSGSEFAKGSSPSASA